MIRPTLESLTIHLLIAAIAIPLLATPVIRPSASTGGIKMSMSYAAPAPVSFESAPPAGQIQEEAIVPAAPVVPEEPVIEQPKPKPKPVEDKPKPVETEKVIKKPEEAATAAVAEPVPAETVPAEETLHGGDYTSDFAADGMGGAWTDVNADHYAIASSGGGIAMPGAGVEFGGVEYDRFINEFIILVQDKLYYPPNARRGRIQGTVKVRVCFNSAGEVVSYELAKHDAHSMLSKAAITTLAEVQDLWKPPLEPGAEQSIVIPIIFEIK